MILCIDPGHSGRCEPGACAAGLTEAALNLSISLAVGRCLRDKGHMVVFTRGGEVESDELWWRAETANKKGADVFLSIHCNAAVTVEASGVETFHHPDSANGKVLATLVQEELVQLAYTRDRGVKNSDFAVLRWTAMPAILVECGFLTHSADREFLRSPGGQAAIAAAMARGIERFAAADTG